MLINESWLSVEKTCETPDWSGHERDTSALLLNVLTTATRFSENLPADRVLFTACEFWRRAERFPDGPTAREPPPSCGGGAAFTVIGITKAATVLRHGRMALTKVTAGLIGRVVEFIETSLAELDEPSTG